MPTLYSAALLLSGRILLAVMFVMSGLNKVGNAAATAGFMATGGLPDWPTLAVIVGLFEVIAGLAVIAGIATRPAALSLALFTLAASLGFHAFWAAPPAQQFVEQLLFTKNVAVIGGLLFVAGVGPGRWSLDAVWPRPASVGH